MTLEIDINKRLDKIKEFTTMWKPIDKSDEAVQAALTSVLSEIGMLYEQVQFLSLDNAMLHKQLRDMKKGRR
jgi:hypothetical protein